MTHNRFESNVRFEIINSSSYEALEQSRKDLSGISDEAIFVFSWVVYGALCPIIGVFGILTNIISIVCFIKQGFKESVNVSLLGLAVSDLVSLVTLVGMNAMLNPSLLATDLSFDSMEVCYFFFTTPHLTFTRVSSWITAVITLERCLCIIAPLKIRTLISSKKMLIITVSVYIVILFSTAPIYAVNSLGITFSPLRNKTILARVSTSDRENVESISYIINNFTIPLIAFVVIVTCTAILVFKLRETTGWRKTSTTSPQVDRVSSRNQKVAKMVVMIACLFIACFAPLCIVVLAVAFEPSLSFGGNNLKIGILFGGIGLILESVNSSANIFIYYHMSSKYRETYCNIFGTSKKG